MISPQSPKEGNERTLDGYAKRSAGSEAAPKREAGFVDLSGLIWIFFIGCGIALAAGIGLTYLGQWFFKHFSWSWA